MADFCECSEPWNFSTTLDGEKGECLYCGLPEGTELQRKDARITALEDHARVLVEALRTLIGCLEIAAVMPKTIQKVYVPRMDAPELDKARAALEKYQKIMGERK